MRTSCGLPLLAVTVQLGTIPAALGAPVSKLAFVMVIGPALAAPTKTVAAMRATSDLITDMVFMPELNRVVCNVFIGGLDSHNPSTPAL